MKIVLYKYINEFLRKCKCHEIHECSLDFVSGYVFGPKILYYPFTNTGVCVIVLDQSLVKIHFWHKLY